MTDDTDIVEKLLDLHKQATTERSHYYVAGCCREAIAEFTKLRAEIDKLKTERGILSDDIARRITERQAVVRAEREACAQIAEGHGPYEEQYEWGTPSRIAAAIRARTT